MHVRLSSSIGLLVTSDEGETLGQLSGILIEPDTGKIEGFFVQTQSFLSLEHLFLSTIDILRWGTTLLVRDADVLSPVEDRVRLASLLEDPRKILGQKIQSESGKFIGRCKDVQFDTNHFVLEWLFPGKWFHRGVPIPISSIIEVRPEAIIIRDREVPVKQEKETSSDPTLVKPLLDMA